MSIPNKGELMMLDTVIGGCVLHFLESGEGLDAQRIGMLEDCMMNLDALMPHIVEEAGDYFTRLHQLGTLLLAAHRR